MKLSFGIFASAAVAALSACSGSTPLDPRAGEVLVTRTRIALGVAYQPMPWRLGYDAATHSVLIARDSKSAPSEPVDCNMIDQWSEDQSFGMGHVVRAAARDVKIHLSDADGPFDVADINGAQDRAQRAVEVAWSNHLIDEIGRVQGMCMTTNRYSSARSAANQYIPPPLAASSPPAP